MCFVYRSDRKQSRSQFLSCVQRQSVNENDQTQEVCQHQEVRQFLRTFRDLGTAEFLVSNRQMPFLQGFDAVGWVAGRASSL